MIIATVAVARAPGSATDRLAECLARQLTTVDRIKLAAKISVAAFKRLVISVSASDCAAGISATTIVTAARAADAPARTARRIAADRTRDPGTPMWAGIPMAAAAENATAPAIDSQNRAKRTDW